MRRITLRPTLAAIAVLGLPLSAFAISAPATSVSYTSNVIALQDTDWDAQLELPLYNGSATLSGVTIELFGEVTGSAQAESTDSRPATLTLNLSADIALALPTAAVATLTASPVFTQTVQASARDGAIDFAGSSGFTFSLVMPVTGSASASFSDAASLALFTGTGTLVLPVSALSNSMTLASGNVADAYLTQAGAYARITYATVAAPVPEPGTWALMAAGLGLVVLRAARQRRA